MSDSSGGIGYIRCKAGMRDSVYDELTRVPGIIAIETIYKTDKRFKYFDFTVETAVENHAESEMISDRIGAIAGIDFALRPGYVVGVKGRRE